MEVSESVMALFSEAASLWSLLCLQKDLLGGIAAAPKREKHRGWGSVWGGGVGGAQEGSVEDVSVSPFTSLPIPAVHSLSFPPPFFFLFFALSLPQPV